MQVTAEHSAHDTLILTFDNGIQRVPVKTEISTLPLIALALGQGKGSLMSGMLTIDEGSVEINTSHSSFTDKPAPHQRLQIGMKLWLLAGLREDVYCQVVGYPKLQIERDATVHGQLLISHANTEMNEDVAVIPEENIFVALTKHLADGASAQYEAQGMELTIKRNGPIFELSTRGQRGDIEWLASPEEIKQIHEKIAPTQVTTKPPASAAPAGLSNGTRPTRPS